MKAKPMSTVVHLTEEELAELKRLTNQSDPTDAIRAAMQDYLRHARRMQLKQLSGQVEMLGNWRQLEQRELMTNEQDRHAGAD